MNPPGTRVKYNEGQQKKVLELNGNKGPAYHVEFMWIKWLVKQIFHYMNSKAHVNMSIINIFLLL